jgi:hypothetical protein
LAGVPQLSSENARTRVEFDVSQRLLPIIPMKERINPLIGLPIGAILQYLYESGEGVHLNCTLADDLFRN